MNVFFSYLYMGYVLGSVIRLFFFSLFSDWLESFH